MTPSELLRLYAIVRVFLTYGLDELIPKMRLMASSHGMPLPVLAA